MKKIITMASSLVASMVLAASCGDEITGIEIPQGTVKLVLNDTNFVQLTNEEMTVLRTMGGQSTKISQKEAVDIAAKFLGKISLSKSAGSVRCDVLTRPSSVFVMVIS